MGRNTGQSPTSKETPLWTICPFVVDGAISHSLLLGTWGLFGSLVFGLSGFRLVSCLQVWRILFCSLAVLHILEPQTRRNLNKKEPSFLTKNVFSVIVTSQTQAFFCSPKLFPVSLWHGVNRMHPSCF